MNDSIEASGATPGPWFLTKDSQWNAIAHVGRAWNISSQLALSHFGDVDADARLLASAPELLKELQSMVALVDMAFSDETDRPNEEDGAIALTRARAAIAKALGITPKEPA
jgi:hypothetical protein